MLQNQGSINRLVEEVSDVVESYIKSKSPDSSKGEKISLREGGNVVSEVLDLRKLPSLYDIGDDFINMETDEIVDILVAEDVLLHEHNQSNNCFIGSLQLLARGLKLRKEGN